MIEVRDLIWDEWNREHVARHGVTERDVLTACLGPHHTGGSYNGRIRLIGLDTVGSMVTVILSPQEEQGIYYVVTARPASRKERRVYRQEVGIDKE